MTKKRTTTGPNDLRMQGRLAAGQLWDEKIAAGEIEPDAEKAFGELCRRSGTEPHFGGEYFAGFRARWNALYAESAQDAHGTREVGR